MKHGFEFRYNGSGDFDISKDNQIFLYKLAAECFKNGSDGCDFILNKIPGYKIKTTVVFEIMRDK